MKIKKRYLLTNISTSDGLKSLDLKNIRVVRNKFSNTIILKVNLTNLDEIKNKLQKNNIKILQVSGTLKSIKNKNN